MSKREQQIKVPIQDEISWYSIATFYILCPIIYVFFEWLFLITKPSYLNNISFFNQISVLLFTIGILGVFGYLISLPLFFIYSFSIKVKLVSKTILFLFPAFLIGSWLFLLVDNFLYTMFHIGVISAKGIITFAYGILFIGFLLLGYSKIDDLTKCLSKRNYSRRMKFLFSSTYFLAVITMVSIFFLVNHPLTSAANQILDDAKRNEYPNILWITTDGLDSTNMSVYGYTRRTTPALEQYAPSMLIFDNAFANTGNTTGSVISMLTGKYPSVTRVLHPPDVLWGNDSIEHLPGILREHGYFSSQITMRYYADAYELNLKDGFSYANYRQPNNGISLFEYFENNLTLEYYLFIEEIWNRLFDRLGYIFAGKASINPFDLLQNYEQQVDEKAIENIFTSIDLAQNSPWFIEVHLLGTHGPTFNISQQRYSKHLNRYKQDYWNRDFYDDSVLEFDSNIEKVITRLEQLNILEETVIIIGSDHGSQWDQTKRIPLLIRFPNSKFKGHIKNNVSNIDIPPTILDYLDIEIPDWMDGDSLISCEYPKKPVLGFTVSGLNVYRNKINFINPTKIHPPFYQFGQISLINCARWYKLTLPDSSLSSGFVTGSSVNCTSEDEMTPKEVFDYIITRLSIDGFDTTMLNDFDYFNITNNY